MASIRQPTTVQYALCILGLVLIVGVMIFADRISMMFQYAPPPLMIIFAAIFGAIMGSYVNMAAYRLPRYISTVTKTRSFCPSCKHQLAWYDNLPIFSYLTIRGHCRYCKAPISSRYLWVEILVAGLFALIAYQYFALNNGLRGPMPLALFFLQLFFVVDLVLISVVDLEMWVIPFQTTIPWMAVGLVLSLIVPELHQSATVWWDKLPRLNAIIDSFTGIVLGLGSIWAVNLNVMAVTFLLFQSWQPGARRPLEGMGDGDAHILGLVGAMMGWKPALLTFFIAIFIGCVAGVSKVLWEKFRRWRLGDKYKPWQPVYDFEEPAAAGAQSHGFWILLVMGIVVIMFATWLYYRSADTWEGPEVTSVSVLFRNFDARLLPVLMMFCLSVLLVFGFIFKSYLARNNLLPQGDIVEKDEGKKEEVLEGNYLPFGPPLALSALLVAIYDPLLRNIGFWYLSGLKNSVQRPDWHIVGQGVVQDCLVAVLQKINDISQYVAGLFH